MALAISDESSFGAVAICGGLKRVGADAVILGAGRVQAAAYTRGA